MGNCEVNNNQFASSGQDSWSVGIVLNLNLFNGGADRARIAEAQANHQRALARIERTRIGIVRVSPTTTGSKIMVPLSRAGMRKGHHTTLLIRTGYFARGSPSFSHASMPPETSFTLV